MKALLALFSLARSSKCSRSFSIMTAITKDIVVDPFCFRQFEKASSEVYGGNVFSTTIAEFEDIVNFRYDKLDLKDGYAPFCKHLFVVNDFTDAQVNILKINPENESLLRTKYDARNEKELPVLVRYFPKGFVVSDSNPLPVAKYLDLILYSREQIKKENVAMGKDTDADNETAPWGIVSIKAQDAAFELPMSPITIMRNALGKEHGGSGVPVNRNAYIEASNYWKDHANIA